MICKPEYDNCSLNIAASMLRHFDVPCSHKTHPYVDELLGQSTYQNVVVMLFDGMGIDLLQKALPEDAFLRQHIGHELSAVYPSTTTNATTCIECGISPVEHGWLGWTLHFDEIDKPVDIFINRSNGEIAADYHVANRYIPRAFIFPKITAAGKAVACCVSPFGDTPVQNLDELFDTTLRLCRDDQRRYIYTYWGDPDHTMHSVGCYHEDVLAIVRDINARVEAFAAALPTDTLVLITADHGLIDAKHHYIEDEPQLLNMLVRLPTIESRAASFHVKPEYLADFPAAFRAAYGENFLLMTRDHFIAEYLGEGVENKKIRDFVGDYMALATDHDCIDGLHRDFELVGVHAGLTWQEMRVPLIVAKK